MNKEELIFKLFKRYIKKDKSNRIVPDKLIRINLKLDEKTIFCSKLILKELLYLIINDKIKNSKSFTNESMSVKNKVRRNFKKISADFKDNFTNEEIIAFEIQIMNKEYKLETAILEEYIDKLKETDINDIDSMNLNSLNTYLKIDHNPKTDMKKFKNEMPRIFFNENIKINVAKIFSAFYGDDKLIIFKRLENQNPYEMESIKLSLENIWESRFADENSKEFYNSISKKDDKNVFIRKWAENVVPIWKLDEHMIRLFNYHELNNLYMSFEKIKKIENLQGLKFDFISVGPEGILITNFKNKYKKYDRDGNFDLFREMEPVLEEYEEIFRLNKKLDNIFLKPYKEAYPEMIEYWRRMSGMVTNLNGRRFKPYIRDLSEIDKFKENFEKIEKVIEYNDEILNSFENNEIFELIDIIEDEDHYLSSNEIEQLIIKFKNLFDENKFILELPESFKKYNPEIKDLYNFLIAYEDLVEYTNISDTDDNNLIKRHNASYLDKEIMENELFFKDIDGKEIDDISKKRAIVYNYSDLRIVAGAGTGKTFTLQSKVKYLIEKKGISPDKILCLCYTNKGAKELDQKVNKLLSGRDKVGVYTFHEFSRRVAMWCGVIKKTNRFLLDEIIRDYFKECLKDQERTDELFEFFAYYSQSPSEFKFNSEEEMIKNKQSTTLKDEYDTIHSSRYQTFLKDPQSTDYSLDRYSIYGETVKNYEELMIANYLFIHNINYKYERTYPYDNFEEMISNRFLDSGKFLSLNRISNLSFKTNRKILEDLTFWESYYRDKYKPNFYLPDYDIYLEHFLIGRNNENIWLNEESAENYNEEMKSRIKWHELYGTNLLKTYSYQVKEGTILEELEKSLKENKVDMGHIDKKEILEIIFNINKIRLYKNLIELIKTFINFFEANCLEFEDLDKFKRISENKADEYVKKREKILFAIIEDIYKEYYERTQGKNIDHNREITIALDLIESGEFDKDYDYILIDEYQDINYIRTKLIQSLKEKTNSKVFVVGDDWQSIYKFNGSEVNLFIDFNDYFPNAITMKIRKSRRNKQKLTDISSEFIQKNPNQIKKELRYYKTEYQIPNPIKIITYETGQRYHIKQKALYLEAIIKEIISIHNDPYILILGRKKGDIDVYVNNCLFKEEKHRQYSKIIYRKHPDIRIEYMTVHKSKGLEADDVIIINMENGLLGFPTKIEDDSIIRYVKTADEYPYAEERRLFYVALTRSKNKVYLMTPEKSSEKSVFIKELEDKFDVSYPYYHIDKYERTYNYDKEVEIYHPTGIQCPNCLSGEINVVERKIKGTTFFRCDVCDRNYGPYSRDLDDIKYVEKCPNCKGMLVKTGDHLECCLNKYGCPVTKELDLSEEEMEEFYD